MAAKAGIHRRDVCKLVGVALAYTGACAALAYRENVADDPASTFVDLNRNFLSADEVAAKFARADSGFLMASYAVFFPEFLNLQGSNAPALLRAAGDKVRTAFPYNHHRLHALPAVAAAHWLSTTKEKGAHDALTHEVLQGLKDPRREVREIVLQNLVTSTAANYDTVQFFSSDSRIIAQLRTMLEEARDNEKLMSPAVLCTEFLLNATALLRAGKAPPKDLQPFIEALEVAGSIKASHLWYVPRIVKLHQASFTADMKDVEALPPQSSEALMGWRVLSRRAPEYMELLAITRARMAYTCYLSASGKLAADTAMSAADGEVALPKILGVLKAFDIYQLATRSPSLVDLASTEEPEFGRFLKSELPELLREPEKFGVSAEETEIPPGMIALRNCVPFAKYNHPGIATRLYQEHDAATTKAIAAAKRGALTALGLSTLLGLAHWYLGRRVNGEQIKAEHIERAEADIETRGKAIDAGEYRGIDEQQASLGSIDTMNLKPPSGGKAKAA